MGFFLNYTSFSKENHFEQNTGNIFIFLFFLKYLHFSSTFCQFKEALQTLKNVFSENDLFHARPESPRETLSPRWHRERDLLSTHSWCRTFPSCQVVLTEAQLAASASLPSTRSIRTQPRREESEPPRTARRARAARAGGAVCPGHAAHILPNRRPGTRGFLKFPSLGPVSLLMDLAPQLGMLQEFKPYRNISLSFITV